MSRTLRNIKLGLDDSLEEHLAWMAPGYADFRIVRQSVDARQRHSPHFVYSVEVFDQGEKPEKPRIEVSPIKYTDRPVVIVGAGPAGLFAALRLGERGIPCILLEQGSETAKRVLAIGRYWRYGELNPRSNVGCARLCRRKNSLFCVAALMARRTRLPSFCRKRLGSFRSP